MVNPRDIAGDRKKKKKKKMEEKERKTQREGELRQTETGRRVGWLVACLLA